MSEHEVQPGIHIQHYKGGTYQIIDIAKHTETGEKMICYRALYDVENLTEEYGIRPLFVRPYALFFEKVKVNGKLIDRFTQLDKQGLE